MITITNRKDKIILNEDELKIKEGNYFFYKNDFYTNWEIEIIFSVVDDNISEIKKSFGSADGYCGDVLSEYPNQIKSRDKVVLSNNDFNEVKRLLDKLRAGDRHKRNAIVNAYAQLLAYECYTDLIVYELDSINVEYIFKDIYERGYFRNEKDKYKKDIYERTKELLKEEYNAELDYIFDGGNEE